MKLIKHDKQILKTTLATALPSMFETFFVCLAGLIASLMVSTLGASSVAAVGLTNQPKFLGLSVFMALNVSVAALVARRFGEKAPQKAWQFGNACQFIGGIISVLLVVIYLFFWKRFSRTFL